ncbi:hypothetical protein M405DRAFT_855505 [Rhizopogon salebrosus TDB-379]|nr:hypothetical protein M405DRAFT_855505 [Rhizopogon salebrosus TDB-379]
MSQRLMPHIMPYVFAGLTGVASGVYIFKPLFEQAAANENLSQTADASTTSSPEAPGKPPGSLPSPHFSAK